MMNKQNAKLLSSKEKGFSLIELLIAMVIFLIVTATIYGLMEIGRTNRDRSSRRSDILKNARVSIQLIGRDALNAGLGYNRFGAKVPDGFLATTFGIPPDPDTNRDILSSIVVGDNIFTNNLSANPATRTDTVAFCYRDLDFNPPAVALPGILSTGQVMQLTTVNQVGTAPQLVSKDAAGASNASVNDLYLVESDTTQSAVMATAVSGTNTITVAPGDPLGINQPYMNKAAGSAGSVLRRCDPPDPGPPPVPDSDCTTAVSTLVRFFLVSYKVKPDGTLVRTIYGNNRTGGATGQVVEQPLAYNIEDLQLRYVLDDGTVVDDPVAATGSQQAVNRIRQIMVTIKVQATEADEQTRKLETITLNATFSTRNMEYDAG